jgi:serine/threonine protein kinase/beta-lactam-binding protein with PASTA domain
MSNRPQKKPPNNRLEIETPGAKILSENQRILAERYEVGSLIGRGGMADVYEGTDTRLGRKVAIKLLKSDLANDPSFEARFRQEAQASARMAHPTIVRVYDAGEELSIDSNGNERRTPYIVMEYVRGTLLRDLLHERAIGVPEAIGYAEGVLTALEFSHRAGIIHRDIKSANIMITDTGLVKVMDFGIARAISDSSTTQAHTTGIVGTAQYFSPEQARGESVDARTDLYSTGVLLYEMLAGRPPFKGETAVSVAYQHVSEAVTPPSKHNPAISAGLDEVVLRALAKNRDERYQSAEEFREHLLAADLTPAPVAFAAELDGAPEQPEVLEPEAAITLEDLEANGEPVAAAEVDPFEALLADATAGAETTAIETAEPESPEPTPAPVTPFTPATPVASSASSGFNSPIPPTEKIGTDTNPFEALGVSFDTGSNDVVATDTGAVKTKKPLMANPGLLWGFGSGALVFLIGMMVWLFTVSLPNITPGPGGIKVADVIGQTYEQAYTTFTEQNLLVERQYEASETVPVNQVIRVDPAVGTSVPQNTTITVWVSTGRTQVDVPDLKGMNEKMAADLLSQSNLVLGEIVQARSASIPAGSVIESMPAAGTKVAAGTVVIITISNGLVEVPNVVNYSISEAQNKLTAPEVNLSVSIETLEECATAPKGTIVLEQSIAPGDAPQGSAITLYVTCAP